MPRPITPSPLTIHVQPIRSAPSPADKPVWLTPYLTSRVIAPSPSLVDKPCRHHPSHVDKPCRARHPTTDKPSRFSPSQSCPSDNPARDAPDRATGSFDPPPTLSDHPVPAGACLTTRFAPVPIRLPDPLLSDLTTLSAPFLTDNPFLIRPSQLTIPVVQLVV